MKITDAAVQAFMAEFHQRIGVSYEANIRASLEKTLPHLQLGYEVKKLEWVKIHSCNGILTAKTNFGTYFIGSNKTVRLGIKTLSRPFQLLDEAKNFAQADFEGRVRECIVTKPVDVAAVRRQAFEEAKKSVCSGCSDEVPLNAEGYHQMQSHTFPCHATAIRALSAEPAQGEQWADFSTPPAHGRFIAMSSGEIEREDWRDPAAVITIKAHEEPLACFVCDDGKTFMDEFGEVYSNDGRVEDAEDLTVADNVLRLTYWHPFPAAPTSEEGR